MTEKLPPEVSDSETFNAMHSQVEAFLNTTATSAYSSPIVHESSKVQDERMQGQIDVARVTDLSRDGENVLQESKRSSVSNARGAVSQQSSAYGADESSTVKHGKKEVIEQFEPGVYVTVILLRNGTKVFKRVRFRYLSKYLSKINSMIDFYIECVCVCIPVLVFVYIMHMYVSQNVHDLHVNHCRMCVCVCVHTPVHVFLF